jgi:hypothetical protein
MNHHFDAIKAACGAIFAVASWAGGKLAQTIDLPDVVKAADTPLIVIGMGYGVFHLWRELKASNAARVADQKAANEARIADQVNFITVLRTDAAKAAESRETLVRATTEQTATLHNQTAAIEALRRTVEENRSRPLLQRNNDDQ